MGRLVFLFLFLGSFSLSHAATDEERAKMLFYNGKELFEEGDYERAIVAWTEAYELSKKDVLLYNIASAHEKLGQFDEAVKLLSDFRMYVADDEKDKLKVRITELEEKAEEARIANEAKMVEEAKIAAEAKKLADAEKAKLEAETKEKALTEPPKVVETVPDIVPPVATSNLQSQISLAVWSVSAVATGTAVAATVLSQRSLAERSMYCNALESGKYMCNHPEAVELDVRHSRQALLADVGWTLAAISVGTGLGMHFMSTDEEATASIKYSGSF
jgi:tetratricopeptide (TPR) repeat protein